MCRVLFISIYVSSKHLYLPADAVENSKDLKLQDNILLILWSITLYDIYFYYVTRNYVQIVEPLISSAGISTFYPI